MSRTAVSRAALVFGATAILAIGLTASVATGNASAAPSAATGAQSSLAQPSGAQPSLVQVGDAETAANGVARRVQSAADRLPGFAGVEVSPSVTHPGVTVYWHGRVPAELARVAVAAGTARATGIAAGVSVRFRSAPYTRAQLRGLQNVVNASSEFFKAGISSMGFFPQATGFWINVKAKADLAKARALVGRTPVAVHYAVSPGSMLSLPGRYKDNPAFSGGDFIQSSFASKNYECSSGFGMHFANKKGAPWFMITAGHCIVHSKLVDQRFAIMGNKKGVGVTYTLFGNDDMSSLLMSRPYGVAGAGGGDTIYTGTTSFKNSSGQVKSPVLGAMALEAGNAVSTSGAFSGQRNGIVVKTLDWEWMGSTIDGLGYRVFGALANQSHHLNAAGHGDSGGPVYVAGKGGVKAVGIISATASTADKAPCTGVNLDRGCYWSLEFPLMTGTSTSIETEANLKVNIK
jgi:hypothetical protein